MDPRLTGNYLLPVGPGALEAPPFYPVSHADAIGHLAMSNMKENQQSLRYTKNIGLLFYRCYRYMF